MVSFAMQKLLSFIGSHLLYFCFYFHYSRRWVKKDLAVIYVKECCSYLTQLYSGENFLWVITIKLNSQVNLNAWYTILNTVQFICYLSLTLLLQIRKLRPKILNDSVPNISQIICVHSQHYPDNMCASIESPLQYLKYVILIYEKKTKKKIKRKEENH